MSSGPSSTITQQLAMIEDATTEGKEDSGVLHPGDTAVNAENETLVEDIEYTAEAASKVGSLKYPQSSKHVLQEERREGRIHLRSHQAVLHLALTHDRIGELEKELKSLKEYVFDSPKDKIVKDNNMKYPIHKREIRRSALQSFDVDEKTYEVPTESRPALEVLLPQTTGNVAVQPQPGAASENLQGPFVPGHQTPEKLRIRSTPLLLHLKKVTGEDVQQNDRVDFYGARQFFQGVLFLRPFKLFVKYEEAIRQSLVDLQSQIDKSTTAEATKGIRPSVHEFEINAEDLLEDLKLLIEFLDNDLKSTLHLRQIIVDGTASEIEFGDLWHLFDLGTIVVGQSDDLCAYRVISFTGGREPLTQIMEDKDQRTPALDGFVVDCLGLTFDGSKFVPSLHKFTITKFSGPQPIHSLPVYPLTFHPQCHKLYGDLRNRGNRFLEITAPPFSHHFMTGRTLDEPSHEVDAPVIVDIAAALNTVAKWRPAMRVQLGDITKADARETHQRPTCKHTRWGDEGCCGRDLICKDLKMDERNFAEYSQNNGRLLGPRRKEELTDEDFLLFPDQVHGYVLRSRQWITMKITDLSEVKYQDNFDKLMLPERHKTSILALVKTHENTRLDGNPSIGAGLDLVKGKGTGLILLLHGEPGVGKTSTAECVADSTKRPLYPITCGDVGETAMEVEKNLVYNFTLAHKWGCVLLLDEADVFLAKRSKADLRRNAVTSVFLRSLEYYAGILFLTTNRVGGIDPAFKSRIHLSLFYPRLGRDETVKLYKVFVQRAKDEQERLGVSTFKIDKKQITEFAKQHYRDMERERLGTWNGRQIRNAFQAAIALVEHEAQLAGSRATKLILGASQFQIVAESSKEFDKYLVSTLGAVDSDIAMREEWRSDRFQNAEAQYQPGSGLKARIPHRPNPGSSKAAVETDTDDTSTDSDTSEDDQDGNSGDSASQGGKRRHEQPTDTNSEFAMYQQFLKFKEGRTS